MPPWKVVFATAFVGLLPAAQAPEGPKPGELGYQPPEVENVLVADTVVHQDTVGGSHQSLLGLAGAPERGFAAVWRDTRDGTLGLYFARFDLEGRAREPERSICSPHTMRRTDAVLALAKDGHGTIAWTAVLGRGAVPFLRCFDAQGGLLGGERMLSPTVEVPQGDILRGGRGDDDASCREPALATLSDGHTAVVWVRAGRLQWLEVTRDGDPVGAVIDPDPKLAAAEAGVRLAVGPTDLVACLWRTKTGEANVTLRRDRRSLTTALGRGIPRAIAADDAGGFWTLLSEEGRSRVQHLGADGKPDRAAAAIEDGRDPQAELVAFKGGAALLERASNAGAPSAMPRLWLFDALGAVSTGSPFTIPSEAAREVADKKLASAGTRLLVAWTDLREGDPNVYGRIVDVTASAEKRLGPELRLNSDRASANQYQPAVASSGEHGALAWTDERAQPPRIYLRRFSTGGFVGDELALPVALEGTPPAPPLGSALRPSIAVRANGDALVCWRIVVERNRSQLVAQVVARDGRARSQLLMVDDGAGEGPLDPACTALSGEHGFAVAWPSGGRGSVRCRSIGADGGLGTVREITAARPADAEAMPCADVDLVELESGRVLCAWTRSPAPGTCSIRGRFLSGALAALGEEIAFEATDRGNDWDPALAAASGGGFVMSWTSGSVQDPVRDAVVRCFDGRARPSAPLQSVCYSANEQDFSDVVRLADGSFAITWEDDISYYDQVYVRRLARDGRSLGPMMRINAIDTEFLPDRVTPRIAAIGEGFAAVYADRHRSRGFDAVFKLVGRSFDGAKQR